MPARGRIPRVVEEDAAEIGACIVRLDHEAAVHVRVPTRLVHEQPPHVVELLRGVPPTLEHGRSPECPHPAGHDPERLAAGVVVGRRDGHPSPPKVG